jgi:uncharacterized protein (TIGR00251 family)
VIRATESGGRVVFEVRLQPRSSREGIDGEWQGALRIRVASPPVDDRANQALIKFLAARLKRPLAAVRIIAGARSRIKRIEVTGTTAAQVCGLLVEDTR